MLFMLNPVCSASLCLIPHFIAVTAGYKMCLVAQFGNCYFRFFGANVFSQRQIPTKNSLSDSVRFNPLTPVPRVTARDEPWPFFHF